MIFVIVSGPPQAYWSVLVLLFFALFIIVLGLDVSIYIRATRAMTPEESFHAGRGLDAVNEIGLDHILSTLSSHEARLEEILNAPAAKDPSF